MFKLNRTFYAIQRSTPGHRRFRDQKDGVCRTLEHAAWLAVQAVKLGTPGLVVRILPFEV